MQLDLRRGTMNIATLQTDTIIVGFDSAWTDAPKAPGAVCAIAFSQKGALDFIPPQLASFAQATEFIEAKKQRYSLCLVALDQPTIVANAAGSRPVERVAASLISFIGGGVQPANTSKLGMFCERAPIWKFKAELGAQEEPDTSLSAQDGLFMIEVFPALALPAFNGRFAQRLRGPKYNPANRRFRIEDWQAVTLAVAETARDLGVHELCDWATEMSRKVAPRKADQDLLDAAICSLVGLIWRACDRSTSAMIGDLRTGYMIAPVSPETHLRLSLAAAKQKVPFA